MIARQKLEGTAPAPSRRQLMIGTGTLAAAAAGLAPRWALAQSAGGYSAAIFAPYIGQGFLVTGDGVNTALRLTGVKTYPRGKRPASLPDPFSLIFRDVANTDVLPAQIVNIEHAGVGSIVVYLNPISKSSSYYEVAFN